VGLGLNQVFGKIAARNRKNLRSKDGNFTFAALSPTVTGCFEVLLFIDFGHRAHPKVLIV
jgi:hypothetical protein